MSYLLAPLLMLLSLAAAGSQAQVDALDLYRVAPDDIISITVLGEPERASKKKITLTHEDFPNRRIKVKLTDPLQADDIIAVGERFF